MQKTIKINPYGAFVQYSGTPLVAGDVHAYRVEGTFPDTEDLTGATVVVDSYRPDGTLVTAEGAIDGQTAYCVLPNNMYAIAGEVRLRLKVLGADGSALTVVEIILNALESEDADITGDDRYPILNQLIAQVEGAVGDAGSTTQLLAQHMAANPIDHPDGSVTEAKLSSDVRAKLNNGGGGGLEKTVSGYESIIIEDGEAGNATSVQIDGNVSANFSATTYDDYYGTFEPTTNPTFVTKDSDSTVLSTTTFNGIELLDMSLIEPGGTVSQRFTDSIRIDENGVATLHKEIKKITAADLRGGFSSQWQGNPTIRTNGFQLTIWGTNTAFSGCQRLYVPSSSDSRCAILSNWVNSKTNGANSPGSVNINSVYNIVIAVDSKVFPDTVTDFTTFWSWFVTTDFCIYLPLSEPIETVLEGTYSVSLADGYTQVLCENAGVTVSYNASIWKMFDNVDAKIEENTHIANMQYHTASIISRMCCVGDSLTVGWGLSDNSGTDASISNKNLNICWGKQYQRLTGTNVEIIGFSGASAIQYWYTPFDIPGGKGDFAQKLATMEEDEVYVIGLGKNFDANTVGTVEDVGQTAATCNKSTFYGAYAAIILTILERTPKAKVFCLTIPDGGAANPYIRNICSAVEGAILLDLREDYADIIYRPEIAAQKTTKRYVHFYPIGYSLIAQSMEYIISDYINKHWEDFRNFGIAEAQ